MQQQLVGDAGGGGGASCLYPGCSKRPTYGVESSRQRQCCAEHAQPGMVNIDLTRCARDNCGTRATFGDPTTGLREFCRKHAPKGMVNVERKKCARVGCLMPPAFWHPKKRQRRCCVEHAEPGMVKLDKKLCPFEGCFTSASYGIVGEKRKFCAAHAQQGMVSIGGRRCAREDCSKRANYGVAGTNKREFCAGHAGPGMVNINIKPGGRRIASGVRRSGGGGSSTITTVKPAGVLQRSIRPHPVLPLTSDNNPDAVGCLGSSGRRPGVSCDGEDVSRRAGDGPICCAVQGCTEIPTSGFRGDRGNSGEGKLRFCVKHSAVEMVNEEHHMEHQLRWQNLHRVARDPAPQSVHIAGSSGISPPTMTASEKYLARQHYREGGGSPVRDGASRGGETPSRVGGGRRGDVDSELSGEYPVLSSGNDDSSRSAQQHPGGRGCDSRRMSWTSFTSADDERSDREEGGAGAAPFDIGKPRVRVMLPWPGSKHAPPLLLTATGWRRWEWQPVVMNMPA